MGEVVNLIAGRAKPGARLPKRHVCKECEEPVETARLQAIERLNGGILLRPILCFSCASAREARDNRILSAARDRDDIVIIRR